MTRPVPCGEFRARIAPRSVEGRDLESSVHGTGSEVVLFLATIHGDEAAGTPLLQRLARELTPDHPVLAGRCAVVVPVVNPDGFERDRRRNANGVDLNRNFPAENWKESWRRGTEPLSEPESRFVAHLIEAYRPARIVSLHQPASQIDYDGPAAELAEHMAAACHLEVERMGTRPGSLGSWAGVDLGIPIVTVELPRPTDRLSEDEAWERYGAMLLAALEGPPPAPLFPAEDP